MHGRLLPSINPQRVQSQHWQIARPQKLVESFTGKNAKFEDGFDKLQVRSFTGRCLLRVGKMYIALEICRMEESLGEEFCREYFGKRSQFAVKAFVEKIINRFFEIAKNRRLANYAIAFTDYPEEEFTFKFSCNRRALVKYHWNPVCRILHVEVPKFHRKSPYASEVVLIVRGHVVETRQMKKIFEDSVDNFRAGRAIYACVGVKRHELKYLTLHDESPNLMDLVVDRFKDIARENVLKNKQMDYDIKPKLLLTYFTVRDTGDCDEILFYLRNCTFGKTHLFIYIGRHTLTLDVYTYEFVYIKTILKLNRRPENINAEDYIIDTKNKVDAILKAIWLNNFFQYTLVFRVCEFSIILRMDSSPRTQLRHHWNAGKNYTILNVHHDRATVKRGYGQKPHEFKLNVAQSSLEQQLQDIKRIWPFARVPHHQTPPSGRRDHEEGVRLYYYSTDLGLDPRKFPPLDKIKEAIENRDDKLSPRLPRI